MIGDESDDFVPGGDGGNAGQMVLVIGVPISALDSLGFICGPGGVGGPLIPSGAVRSDGNDGGAGSASHFWKYSANGGAGGMGAKPGYQASSGFDSEFVSFRWSSLGLVNPDTSVTRVKPICSGGGRGSTIYSNGVSDPSMSDSPPVGGVASSSPPIYSPGVSGSDGANGTAYSTYFGCGGAGGVAPADYTSRAGGSSILGGGGGGGAGTMVGNAASAGGKGGDGWLLIQAFATSP